MIPHSASEDQAVVCIVFQFSFYLFLQTLAADNTEYLDLGEKVSNK